MSESKHRRLKISSVIGAGLQIYRDRFWVFFLLAFKAHCWLFIPLYGWAKFAATLGQISRLAYNDVIKRPETAKEACQRTNHRKWSFLLAAILVTFILFGATVGASILLGMAVVVGSAIASMFVQQGVIVQVAFFLFVLGIIAFLCVYCWLFPRLSVVELPIAVEGVMATVGIKRSWQLTKGSVLRLLGIFSFAFVLTLPLVIVVAIVRNIVQVVLIIWLAQGSTAYLLLYIGASVVISFASSALVQPFWQSIKAVVYAKLRGDHS